MTTKATVGEFWGRSRTYPMPKVGDVLGGNLRVVGGPTRGSAGVRVEVQCTVCGWRTETYDYNARKGHRTCAGAVTERRELLLSVDGALAQTRQQIGDNRPLYQRALEARGSYRP